MHRFYFSFFLLFSLPFFLYSSSGFLFDATLLFWQTQENGLSSWIDEGDVCNPHFEWDFGFRVAAGYLFPRDQWKLGLSFTSFQTHTDAFVASHSDHRLYPVWALPDATTPLFATSAKMHWRLHLGILDLVLAKELHPAEKFFMEASLGLSAASLRQKYHLEYRGVPSASSLRMKNKFQGIGPLFSLLTKWQFHPSFSLFAKGTLRLLCGEFYLHQDKDLIESKEKVLGVRNTYDSSSAALEAMLGVMWTFKRLRVHCAFDQLLFFSQNQLMRFASDSSRGNFLSNQGDLSIRGVELGAEYLF